MTATEPKLQRWKCICAYDGTEFAGWQSQVGGTAIQDTVEACLAKIFNRDVRIYASGRTDAGVHAHAQVFHFDASWKHGVEKLLIAFRMHLPESIQVKSARVVKADFHSRFGATFKRYTYQVHQGDADPFNRPFHFIVFRPLNLAAMKAAAKILVGEKDFRAFTANNGPAKEDTVRNLRRLDVVKRGRKFLITAEADGFLYKMMRSLAGVLVAVGEGKLTPEDVRVLLESRLRTPAVKTAPPQGLFLIKVFYS